MQDLNLAVIGNCTLGALIDRRGRYVCCYPRLDGDPIFCNLLRDAAGDGLFDDRVTVKAGDAGVRFTARK